MKFILAAALATAIHVPHGYRAVVYATGGRRVVLKSLPYGRHQQGRRVVRVRRGNVRTLATGIDHPLALAVGPSGGLLVADWGRGVIYEIVRA